MASPLLLARASTRAGGEDLLANLGVIASVLADRLAVFRIVVVIVPLSRIFLYSILHGSEQNLALRCFVQNLASQTTHRRFCFFLCSTLHYSKQVLALHLDSNLSPQATHGLTFGLRRTLS